MRVPARETFTVVVLQLEKILLNMAMSLTLRAITPAADQHSSCSDHVETSTELRAHSAIVDPSIDALSCRRHRQVSVPLLRVHLCVSSGYILSSGQAILRYHDDVRRM